jgi:RNA methyltransferase, TrmH family
MKRALEPRGGTRVVTSLQNERVKLIRSLEMRKVRRDTGLFMAEGASVLVTARDAGWKPRMLVVLADAPAAGVHRELLDWAEAAGAECLQVTEAVLGKLAAKDNPQTVLGVFEQRWLGAPAPETAPANTTWVALEGVRDPGNLGTIIRTADAVGAGGVALVGNCVDPYAREAVRATMGSIFNVPLMRMSVGECRAWLSRWTGDVVGTQLTATEDFRARPYRAPTLLLMGGEGPGLSQELGGACTRLVKIPMAGRLDSLNLAVATALMLYEIAGDRLRL